MRVVCEIFKYDNDKMTKKDQKIEIKLTDEDQQIIHYVAGYIIFALTNKYRRLCENSKNFGAKDILLFLGSLKIKSTEEFSGENFLKFVEWWTNLFNRWIGQNQFGFFCFYPTSRSCGSENLNTRFPRKVPR